MEAEFIVKIIIFLTLGILAIYFVYQESIQLEEELNEHERACRKELEH